MFLAFPLLIERADITDPGASGLAAFGLCMSAYGCTNLAATLVVGSRTLPKRLAPMVFGSKALTDLGIALLSVGSALGLPGLMLVGALVALGGPIGDIPLAVLWQTELPPGEIAASIRAFLTVNYVGALVAMLLAASIAAAVGPAWLVVSCGIGMMLLSTGTFLRFTLR